jgi:hypothetical protein
LTLIRVMIRLLDSTTHQKKPREIMNKLVVCLLLLVSGCATIFSGRDEAITFKSVPEGASVNVTDRYGQHVNTATTPSTLQLKRGAGYFKPQNYEVTVNMPGYQSTTVHVTSSLNGWYWGNILLGGLIGMVIVDPITGSMYALNPKEMSVTLGQPQAVNIRNGERILTVVLAQDVAESVLESPIPISTK